MTDQQLLATARFKVGDTVVTVEKVRPLLSTNKPDNGWALPGWKWVVTKVYVAYHYTQKRIFYDVVAESAPGMYHQRLRDKEINRKVEPTKKYPKTKVQPCPLTEKNSSRPTPPPSPPPACLLQ